MLIQADSRRRITIPPSAGVTPGEALDLQVLPDGRMLLTPVKIIPKHQLWAWTPENRGQVASSLADPRPSAVVESAEDADRIAERWERED